VRPNDVILDIHKAEAVNSTKTFHWRILCLVQGLFARWILAAEDVDDVVNGANFPCMERIIARWHDVLVRGPQHAHK